ncbi:hypothetical protein IQ06DRAFT_345611 [Phaeosphaeriaceae sp. SRC1lsM3a]|nr:hypothetical protein IQ06DRAFT_345611 [Stagonospora sp. SRC1lsM3a]
MADPAYSPPKESKRTDDDTSSSASGTSNATSDPNNAATFEHSTIDFTPLSDAELNARMNSPWLQRESAISAQLFALPSSSERPPPEIVKDYSTEPRQSPQIRRPEADIANLLKSSREHALEAKSPIKDPNWGDGSFMQTRSKERHLHSEFQNQIESWMCGNAKCEVKNTKEATRCVGCGWGMPNSLHKVLMKDGMYGLIPLEEALRELGRQEKFLEERPTSGTAMGGGKWMPKRDRKHYESKDD